MNTLLACSDVIALIVLWWASYATLHGGHEVRDWRDSLLTLALIVLKVCAFCGAIAVAVDPVPLPWWLRGTVYSAAVVGAWAYDYRFGVRRHLRMARAAVVDAYDRLRARGRGHA